MTIDDSRRILTRSIDINATPETIWALLTSPEEIGNWYDDPATVTQLEPKDAFQVGSKFVLTRSGVTTWCVVTAMEPLHRLSWSEERDGQETVFVDFRLDQLGRHRTRLTHTKAMAR